MLKIIKFIGKSAGFFLILLICLAAVQYALCPIYKFPEPTPFSGNSWYNPYEDLTGKWYKANFHAHTISWFHMTDGKDTNEELISHYQKLGYDIICISNYMRLTPVDTSKLIDFRVYEHGYNSKKRHYLAINAKKVDWRDYLLWQNLHHKQHMINIMKESSSAVAIAHPKFHHGFVPEDMKYLTGYDFIEVLNHYRKSFKIWDAALSSGRVGWIIGDDDTHNCKKSSSTGVCWTMINSPHKSKKSIIKAMKSGRTIGVLGKQGIIDNQLQSLKIDSISLSIKLIKPAEKIVFIGQNGIKRGVEMNSDSAHLRILPEDTYIRTVVYTDSCRLYLNPVFRCSGEDNKPEVRAEIDRLKTLFQRLIILVVLIILFYLYKRIKNKKK